MAKILTEEQEKDYCNMYIACNYNNKKAMKRFIKKYGINISYPLARCIPNKHGVYSPARRRRKDIYNFIRKHKELSVEQLVALINNEFEVAYTETDVVRMIYSINLTSGIASSPELTENKKDDGIYLGIPSSDKCYNELINYNNRKSSYAEGRRIYVKRKIYNWVSNGGTIPEGNVVLNIDCDIYNDDISNLTCVPQKVFDKYIGFFKRNKDYSIYPLDFKKAVLELFIMGCELEEVKAKLEVNSLEQN